MKILDKLTRYEILEITYNFKNYKKKGYDILLEDKTVYIIEPTFRQTDKYLLYSTLLNNVMYFKNIKEIIRHIKKDWK